MWSKGAVVVLKHGDKGIVNAISDGMGLVTVPSRQIETLERDNFFLKGKSKKNYIKKIRRARRKYGKRNGTPLIFQPILIAYGLIVYGANAVYEWCIDRQRRSS